MSDKFTIGQDGVTMSLEDEDDEDSYAILKDGKAWKLLSVVEKIYNGQWRWGNDYRIILKENTAPDEFWERFDRESSGDNASSQIGGHYVRVHKVEVKRTEWQKVGK